MNYYQLKLLYFFQYSFLKQTNEHNIPTLILTLHLFTHTHTRTHTTNQMKQNNKKKTNKTYICLYLFFSC